jgi:hypothetical protein
VRTRIACLRRMEVLCYSQLPLISKSSHFLTPWRLQFVEVGRSEVVRDSLDPEFVQAFQVTYFFEESQTVKIEVGPSSILFLIGL